MNKRYDRACPLPYSHSLQTISVQYLVKTCAGVRRARIGSLPRKCIVFGATGVTIRSTRVSLACTMVSEAGKDNKIKVTD